MAFRRDLENWLANQVALRVGAASSQDIKRLLRGADVAQLGPDNRSGLPGEYREARPPTQQLTDLINAYLETGLADFGNCAPAPFISFTSLIDSWRSARIAEGAFTLIGLLSLSGGEGGNSYPPMQLFSGVDFESGSSNVLDCGESANYTPPSSWSGKLMQLWVQAKYGSGASVQSVGHVMGAIIDGNAVQNTAAQSHWIYEHHDAQRFEYWVIEANSEGELRAGLMLLDASSVILRDYVLANSGMSPEDKDWMRGWILRGASWPVQWEQLISVLPAVGGLGYGWHVSESGALASIHGYALVDRTENSTLHHGSDWERHDLSLSLLYVGSIAQWSSDVSTTSTGYLETINGSGLTIWAMGLNGIPGWFRTDTRINHPDPLPSDAEIWGWYEGEVYKGISVSDTGTANAGQVDQTDYPTCEQSSVYAPGCTYGSGSYTEYKRKIAVDDENIGIGFGTNFCSFQYWWSGSGTQGPTEDEPQRGNAPGYYCNQEDESTDPPPDPDCVLADAYWWGKYSFARRSYQSATGVTDGGQLSLVIPNGTADSHIVAKVISNSLSGLTDQRLSAVSAVYNDWYGEDVYSCNTGQTERKVRTHYTFASANLDAAGISWSGADETNTNGSTNRDQIEVDLKCIGLELNLWGSSGGTTIGAPGDPAAPYQGSGTMETGGWLAYIEPDPVAPSASPIYARRSAIQGIVDSCTAPGCAERVASDLSAGDPFPGLSVWVGVV